MDDLSFIPTPTELESMIAWRERQIRALHAVRQHLGRLRALAPRAAGNTLTHAPASGDGSAPSAYLRVMLWDGSEVATSLDFLPVDQRWMLAQVLQQEAGKSADSCPLALTEKQFTAIKQSLWERIDVLQQRNRDDFEELRLAQFGAALPSRTKARSTQRRAN